ncbi:MAG: hypothetical protein LUE31_12175 [Lachnospiraceae bacterium]|nr:hypothetical protein [Lachnospiraceae bacterium]
MVDASFYYPLSDPQAWTEEFVSTYSYWNYRIWGDEEWDFSKTYTATTTSGTSYTRWPDSVKTFEFTGNLDGTLYVPSEEDSSVYVPAVDENGQVKCHTLSNMCDYLLSYAVSTGKINGYTPYGYALKYVNGGSITNLNIENFSVGLLRSEHEADGYDFSGAYVTGDDGAYVTVGTPWNETLKQMTRDTSSYFGFLYQMSNYASMENVHLLDCCMAPYRSGMERIGGLVGYCSSYCSFMNCSATNLLLSTSSVAAELEAGGLVGYAATYISFTDCYAAKLELNAPSSTNTSFASYGVGGLVGRASSLTLMNCYSFGTLTSDVAYTGGLVGRVESLSDISGCYSAMNISLSAANGAGLIGGNTGMLTVDRCLYTGALSAASSSGTIHLILGYNTLSAVLTDCYAYQPHMEEGDSLLDTGAEQVSYSQLTGSTDFYETLFPDESWLFSWSYGSYGYNTTTDAHLPALAGVDTDGEYVEGALYGQLSANGSECYVPTVAEESLEIKNVWAFASEDRADLAENSKGNVVYDPKEGIYSWNYDSVTTYEPNDVEFELVLGNYQVKSITLDGFASGGVSDTSRFAPDDGITAFTYDMFDPEVYEVRIHLLDSETGTYQICLLGTEVISYRDTYTITVELTNGIVLKNTFQFRNADGEEEAKYLTINNAYEWNLYLGAESDQSTLLAAIEEAAKLDPTDANYNELLASYAGWTPYGYGTSSMNIEIGYEDGTSVDFADLYALGVTPYTNVVANNVRGATTEGDGGTTVQNAYIKGLKLTNAAKTTYSLFRSIAGSLTDLSFESNTINWKASSAASNESGLIGSLAGGMDNVSFSDIELTGGGSYFGLVGSATGTFNEVTAEDLMVESDGSYVGALAGVLYGDLTTVSVEKAEVSGTSYVGVAVGYMYSTEHETNGHAIIGGTDYTDKDGTGAVAYEVSEDEDWYADFMEEDDWYYVDSSNEAYRYDSLSFDYALMDDVTIKDSAATARNNIAGGVAARVSEMTSTNMGYGYLIAQDVTVENVTMGAMMSTSTSTAYVGGLTGYTRAFMAHNITLTNVYVDGSDGYFAGGMIGDSYAMYNYEYSAVGASGDRVTYFMSTAENIDAESVTVIGGRPSASDTATSDGTGAYVGGLFGRITDGANVHAVTLKDIAVYGAGSYVGGLDGRATYYLAAYFTDVTADNVQVYNEGVSTYSYYTGGLLGYGGAIRRLTATDITVSARGASTYVGGVSGGYGTLFVPVYGSSDYAEPIYKVTGVQVYGYNNVGGVGGYRVPVRYLSASDITMTGTGDNVGGLVGQSNTTFTYVSASDITVTGRGANVGGAAGSMNTSISYSDFSDITVRATDSGASSIAVAYLDGVLTSEGDLRKGSAVGGVVGSTSSAIYYVSVTDVEVYASGSYVGGVVGATNSYLTYVVADDLDVHASGDDVGGMAGHLCTTNSCYANSVTDADVYTAGDYVGGFAGYVRSGPSGYSSALYSNMVQATVTTTAGKYAGGFAGYSYYVYQFFNNTVEADVSAAGNYVGGMIGYALRPTDVPALYYYRNIVTSKVSGADYVGGQIGFANTTLTGAYYRCVTAAQLTATGVHVSYFYTDANATEAYQSDYNWNNNASHPYMLYLWSGSSITIGDDTTFATNETFASNLSSRNGQTAIYWTAATDWGEKSSLNGESYQIKLVTTADLENINLYTGGNAYDALGISVYSGTVTSAGDTVYYSNMDNMVGTDNVWNQYGLYKAMVTQPSTYTGEEGTETLYLPSPINPLRMSRTVMADVNGVYRFSGYQNTTIALGTAVSDGSGSVTYSLEKDICVPGTAGSILTASNTNSTASLADVDFKNSPKIYAANAYTLNVEFTSDDTYEGAVITAYYTDDSGDMVIGYEATAVDGTLTYGMYYDFQTTITVEIANATYYTNDEPTSNRTVLYSFEVTPSSVTRKVVMSGSYMYAIGGDGLIYQYYTNWSADTESADMNNNLETDEYFINLVLDSGGNVTALTNKGTIWLVAGTDTNSVSGCMLNLTGVGEAVSTNLTAASAGTGNSGAIAPQRMLGSEYILLATAGNDLSGMLSSETESEDEDEANSTSDDTSSTEAASSDSSEGTSTETTSDSSETASGSTAAALEEADTTSNSSETASEETSDGTSNKFDSSLLDADLIFFFD